MPNTIDIGEDYLKEINNGKDIVSEIVTFLQDHFCSDIDDYSEILGFSGYIDDNSEAIILLMDSKVLGDSVTITADLQYNLVEQQNSCADSLASVMHSARLLFSYKKNDTDITFELGSNQFSDDYHPEEYGG